MHEYASEQRQQAEPIQGLGTMFGLREVGRKPVGAEHRQPVQSAVHAQANFIGMGHWRHDEPAPAAGSNKPQPTTSFGGYESTATRAFLRFLTELRVPFDNN